MDIGNYLSVSQCKYHHLIIIFNTYRPSIHLLPPLYLLTLNPSLAAPNHCTKMFPSLCLNLTSARTVTIAGAPTVALEPHLFTTAGISTFPISAFAALTPLGWACCINT